MTHPLPEPGTVTFAPPSAGDAATPHALRQQVREAEQEHVDAAVLAAIASTRLAIAREAAGLPPDPSLSPPRDRALTIVGRIGGDDGRGGGWTADRQRAFLGHLAASASVSHACHLVGLSKQSAYALRARAPQSVFAILWDVAVGMGRRRLYDEALERAMAGREVAVWHRGEEVGTRHVPNDRLLMFLLAHEPPAAHPVLDPHQLAELWPALMQEVDAVLPPSLTPDRVAEMVADDAANGNDRRGK